MNHICENSTTNLWGKQDEDIIKSTGKDDSINIQVLSKRDDNIELELSLKKSLSIMLVRYEFQK